MVHPIGIILTSVDDASMAEALARGLIEERLAACVQLTGPGGSVYRWNDAVQQSTEFYLNIKAPMPRVEAVVAWLQNHHPYDTPEIIVLEAQAAQDYAAWAEQVTKA